MSWEEWGGSLYSCCSLEDGAIFKMCCATKVEGRMVALEVDQHHDSNQRPDPSTAACKKAPSRFEPRSESSDIARFKASRYQDPRLDKKGQATINDEAHRIRSVKSTSPADHDGQPRRHRAASVSPSRTSASSLRNSTSPSRAYSRHGPCRVGMTVKEYGGHQSPHRPGGDERENSKSPRNSRYGSPVRRSHSELTSTAHLPHAHGLGRSCLLIMSRVTHVCKCHACMLTPGHF